MIFSERLLLKWYGYDAKDDKLSGNPNQLNIKSMYSDIDIDANNMEMEYQSSLMKLYGLSNNTLPILAEEVLEILKPSLFLTEICL